MSNPPKYIDINEPLTPQTVTTIVVPEDVRQQLTWVRNDTRQCMTDIYMLKQDYNKLMNNCSGSSLAKLEDRISALEKIVRRLEDYIENWLDVQI